MPSLSKSQLLLIVVLLLVDPTYQQCSTGQFEFQSGTVTTCWQCPSQYNYCEYDDTTGILTLPAETYLGTNFTTTDWEVNPGASAAIEYSCGIYDTLGQTEEDQTLTRTYNGIVTNHKLEVSMIGYLLDGWGASSITLATTSDSSKFRLRTGQNYEFPLCGTATDDTFVALKAELGSTTGTLEIATDQPLGSVGVFADIYVNIHTCGDQVCQSCSGFKMCDACDVPYAAFAVSPTEVVCQTCQETESSCIYTNTAGTRKMEKTHLVAPDINDPAPVEFNLQYTNFWVASSSQTLSEINSCFSGAGMNNEVFWGRFGGGDSISATYTDLPTHKSYKLSFKFYFLDAWNANSVIVKEDTTTIFSNSHSASSAASDICFEADKDLFETQETTYIAHTGTSLAITIETDIVPTDLSVSWGITDIKLTLVMCSSPFCESCDTDEDVCDSCITGFYSDGAGGCYAECPAGFGKNSIAYTCDTCTNSDCASCPEDPDICEECDGGFFLKNDDCVATCTDDINYIADSDCLFCPPGCSECTDEDTCQTISVSDTISQQTLTMQGKQQISKFSQYKYAEYVTDQAVSKNFYFAFASAASKSPRIHSITKYVEVDSSSADADIPALELDTAKTLTYTTVELAPLQYNEWLTIGFETLSLSTYFTSGDADPATILIGKQDSATPIENHVDMATIFLHKVFDHDATQDLYCKVQASVSGHMIKMYANGKFINFGSAESETTFTITTSEDYVMLQEGQMVDIVIIGKIIRAQELEFTNCQRVSDGGSASAPTATGYFINRPLLTKDVAITSDSGLTCPSSCSTCSQDNVCNECTGGNYLYQGQCFASCADGLYVYDDPFFACTSLPKSFLTFIAGLSHSALYNIDLSSRFLEQLNYGEAVGYLSPYSTVDGGISRPVVIDSSNPKMPRSYQTMLAVDTNPSTPEGFYTYSGSLQAIHYTNMASQSANFKIYLRKDNEVLHISDYDEDNLLDASMTHSYLTISDLTVPIVISPNPSKTSRIEFMAFLAANTYVNFEFEGTILAVANEKQVLADLTFSTQRTYGSFRPLSDLNLIQITISDSSMLSITFSNSPSSVFTFGDLLYESAITLAAVDNCATQGAGTGCSACDGATCYGCDTGFVENLTGECVTECDNMNPEVIAENGVCTSVDNCPLPDGVSDPMNPTPTPTPINSYSKSNTYSCVPICEEEDHYFTITNDCNNECHPNCKRCYGPTDNDCYDCEMPKYITEAGECACPEGFPLNDDYECEDNSYVHFEEILTNSPCVALEVTALTDPDETGIILSWTITSNSTDPGNGALLSAYAAEAGESVLIADEDLENDVEYVFSVTYTNMLGRMVSNSTSVYLSEAIPTISFPEGTPFTLNHKDDTQVTASLTFECGNEEDYASEVEPSWEYDSGDLATEDDISSEELSLTIPQCSLKPDNTYYFEFTAYVPSAGVGSSKLLEIVVDPPTFVTQISGGERIQPVTADAVLKVELLYDGGCVLEDEQITYVWSCQVSPEGDEDFETCSDPDDIFGEEISNATFVVPSDYLEVDTDLRLSVQVNRNGVAEAGSATTDLNVKAEAVLLSINCTEPLDCRKYSKNSMYIFIVKEDTEMNDEDATYNWIFNVTPSSESGILPVQSFNRKLRISPYTGDFDADYVNLFVNINSTSYEGRSSTRLIVNTVPAGGLVSVSKESGAALSDDFTFTASDWVDEDGPLKYEFSYIKKGEDTTFTSFGIVSTSNTFTTKLVGSIPNSIFIIRAKISDSYGAFTTDNSSTEITVTNELTPPTIQDYVEFVSGDTSANADQKISAYIQAYNGVNEMVKNIYNESETYCPDCSGNGKCEVPEEEEEDGGNSGDDEEDEQGELVCVCNPGYKLANCNLTEDAYETFQATELSILEKTNEAFNPSTTTQAQVQSTLQLLRESSKSVFRGTESIDTIQDLLDKMTSAEAIEMLTAEETVELADIVNNLFTFIKRESNCDTQSKAGQRIQESVVNYVNLISQRNLELKMPGDPPTIINTENFDIVSQALTQCTIKTTDITPGNGSPTARFIPKSDKKCNDNKEVNVEFVVINSNSFNCSSDEIVKNTIGMILSDESGANLIAEYSAELTMAEGVPCPEGCTRAESGVCECPDLGIFDVKQQFQKLFAQSNIGKIGNLSALADWEFYKSSTFYILTGVVIWTIASLIIVLKTSAKSACVITSLAKMENPSNWQRLKAATLSAHPLLSIYYFTDKEISKVTKIMVYSVRIITLLTFASIFATSANTGQARLLAEPKPVFNVYYLLLPYVTIIPIQVILITLIKNPAKVNKKGQEVKYNKKCNKVKRGFGFFLTFCVMAGCIFSVFVIDAQSDHDDRMQWLVLFAQTFFQDFFITPLVFLIVQSLFLGLLQLTKIKKNKKIKTKIEGLMKDTFKSAIDYDEENCGVLKTKKKREKLREFFARNEDYNPEHDIDAISPVQVKSSEEPKSENLKTEEFDELDHKDVEITLKKMQTLAKNDFAPLKLESQVSDADTLRSDRKFVVLPGTRSPKNPFGTITPSQLKNFDFNTSEEGSSINMQNSLTGQKLIKDIQKSSSKSEENDGRRTYDRTQKSKFSQKLPSVHLNHTDESAGDVEKSRSGSGEPVSDMIVLENITSNKVENN